MKRKSLSLFLTLLILISSFLTACQEASTTAITNSIDTTVGGSSNPPEEPPVLQADPIKILSFNLRYDVSSHKLLSTEVRGKNLLKIIDKYDPDSISFCEATDNWMRYLRDAMKQKGYDYIGVGRDYGKDNASDKGNQNEHSPVFYKADKYDLIDSGTFWLSTTPEVAGSKSWDSADKRICSFAVLKNKKSGEVFAHLSTHLDHESEDAKFNGVMVIETYVREILKKHGNIGIVLSGDFNTKINSQPYESVATFMDDSRFIATKTGVVGSSKSGYTDPDKWESGNRTTVDPSVSPIDYIFVKKGAYSVNYYTVVDDTFTFSNGGKTWHDHPVSDHFGVFAEIALTKPSVPFTKDEKKMVLPGYKATMSTTRPDGLLPAYTGSLSIRSSLPQLSTHSIENLLKDDSSKALAAVNGNKHGFWEITIESSDKINLNGLSIQTGNNVVPQLLKVFIYDYSGNWKQIGQTYDQTLEKNTTYYLKTDYNISTQKIKLIFSDTHTQSALTNITLYGEKK